MSQVVIFLPSDPVVPNRAKEYISSANTPEYSGNPDALINPDLSALLPSIPVKYWKRSGSLVIEMTSGEKTALDDSESAAATAATRTSAKAQLDGFVSAPLFQRAFADIAKEEINILRQQVIGVTTFSFDPANLADGTGSTKNDVTVTGATFGDAVDVIAPYTLQGVLCIGYVHAANTVAIRLQNETGGAINLASGNWKVIVRRHSVMAPRTLTQLKTAIKNRVDDGSVDT